MKKTIASILAVVMLLSLAACGAQESKETSGTAAEPAAEQADPAASAAELQPGEPSSTGDGQLATIEDFYWLVKWVKNMDQNYQRKNCTYEFVVEHAGVEGSDQGNGGSSEVTPLGDHNFIWYWTETEYLHCGFRANDEGKWTMVYWNTSGLNLDDIPDSIEVSYEKIIAEGAEAAGGTFTEDLECFGSDIITPVSMELPDYGWVTEVSVKKLYIYNLDSLSERNSGSAHIQFSTAESLDKLNAYLDKFENLQDLGERTIGGFSLQARSYRDVGMDWTEYYGELPNGLWICIKATKVDLSDGSEAKAILDSVNFG